MRLLRQDGAECLQPEKGEKSSRERAKHVAEARPSAGESRQSVLLYGLPPERRSGKAARQTPRGERAPAGCSATLFQHRKMRRRQLLENCLLRRDGVFGAGKSSRQRPEHNFSGSAPSTHIPCPLGTACNARPVNEKEIFERRQSRGLAEQGPGAAGRQAALASDRTL